MVRRVGNDSSTVFNKETPQTLHFDEMFSLFNTLKPRLPLSHALFFATLGSVGEIHYLCPDHHKLHMMNRLFTALAMAICCMAARATAADGTAVVRHFDEDDGFVQSLVTCVMQDSDGLIWLASWSGLYSFDGCQFHRYGMAPGDGTPLESNRLDYVEEAGHNSLRCLSRNEEYLFDKRTGRFVNKQLRNKARRTHRYVPSDSLMALVAALPEFAGIDFRLLLRDRQGGLWAVSHRGLERIHFKHSPPVPSKWSSAPEESVRGLYADKRGRLWVADKNGYVRITDGQSGRARFLAADGTLADSPKLFGASVYKMLEDSKGRLWMGAKPDGLYRLDERGDGSGYAVTHYTKGAGGLNDNEIYDLLEDASGRIFVATYNGGLNVGEEDASGTWHFANKDNALHAYPSRAARCRCLLMTAEGTLLVGTTHGLYASDPRKPYTQMAFTLHERRANDDTSLSSNYVMHMLRTAAGEVYIVTSGGVDKARDNDWLSGSMRFDHLSTLEEQASGVCLALGEDAQHRLWMVAESSLGCVSPGADMPVIYRKSLFAGRFLFTEAPPVFTREGQLLVGTTQGCLALHPDDMAKSRFVPPIIANRDSVIDLWSDNPRLDLTFAALDYNRNEDILYAYLLEGVDSAWHYTRNNTLSYIELKPGTYRLHVKSTNGDGVWTHNERVFTLHRHARFTETPWAWMLFGFLACAVAAALIGVYRYIRRLQNELKSLRLTGREQVELLGDRLREMLPVSEHVEEIAENTDIPAPDDEDFINKAEAFIDRNIDNADLSINDFAAEMGVSRTILYARIKRTFNTTPNNLVVNRRIAHAKKLLLDNELQVAEVAYACGFNDPKYFSRIFKKLVGVRPTEYKEQA